MRKWKTRQEIDQELQEYMATLPEVRRKGVEALQRLLELAMAGWGNQAKRISWFLLGLYNGPRFLFDMTELRLLDVDLLEDCFAVLAMDATPEKEVHQYFENGEEIFEQLAKDWGLGQNWRPFQ